MDPRQPGRRREADPWWFAARLTVGAAFQAGYRVRFSGLRNIPGSGGALLAYNHLSVLDALPVGLGAWHRGRRARFMGLAGDMERPVMGFFLRQTGMIPIRRGLGDWSAIELVADVLRTGGLAGMAPEGTVGPGPDLQPLQRGAARIALAAQAPIIPVGVWGTQHRWGKEGLRWGPPYRPVCGVAFGHPLQAKGDPKRRPDVLALTEELAAHLSRAVAQARSLTD